MTQAYPKTVQLFGDSHNSTLRIASNRLKADNPLSQWHFNPMLGPATDFFERFFDSRPEGLFLLNPSHIARSAPVICDEHGRMHLPEDRFSLISLGMHSNTFLSGKRWVTHSHWQTEAAATRLGLSDAVFRAMVLGLNRHILDFFEELQRRGHSFAVLSSPPPTRRFSLFQLGYSAQDVLFLNRLYRAIIEEALGEIGIGVIAPPDSVIDSDGFLLEDYLIEDVNDRHHGNADYAALMMDKLWQTIGAESSPRIDAE